MAKLLSPEERTAKKVEVTKKFLERAETTLAELLGPYFGIDRQEGTAELDHFAAEAMKVWKLSMALRRFPIFDPKCLSSMKEFIYVRRVGSEDLKIKVMVPTFAIVAWNNRVREFYLGHTSNKMLLGSDMIDFDIDLQHQNCEALAKHRLHGEMDSRLTAVRPNIPVDVERRVSGLIDCFEYVSVVWEAEWSIAPVKDPLVIGTVLERHFLIDQYDTTKLERYISSEMTSGPSK